MKTEPKGHVWLVQVSGTDADIWDTEEHAMEAAYNSVTEMMCAEDWDDCARDNGLDVPSQSQEDVIRWWNENREPFILVECRRILTK